MQKTTTEEALEACFAALLATSSAANAAGALFFPGAKSLNNFLDLRKIALGKYAAAHGSVLVIECPDGGEGLALPLLSSGVRTVEDVLEICRRNEAPALDQNFEERRDDSPFSVNLDALPETIKILKHAARQTQTPVIK